MSKKSERKPQRVITIMCLNKATKRMELLNVKDYTGKQ